jgi:hypothetical protein
MLALFVLLLSVGVAGASSEKWTIQPTPNPASCMQGCQLEGVACPSASDCVAVGFTGDPRNTGKASTLVEVRNGSQWTVQPSPNPAGSSDSELYAVACPSLTHCVAVGTANNRGKYLTLVEVWNGSHWTVQPSPNPAGSSDSELYAMACPSLTHCVAVGTANNRSKYLTLVEVWNGSQWTIQTSPNRASMLDDVLNGVACPSSGKCVAVGYTDDANSDYSLAEVWNGSSHWTIQPTPNLGASSSTYLAGVSCTSVTHCVAAGTQGPSGGACCGYPLVEVWNGSRWTIQPTPIPANAGDTTLAAVNCASSTACTAVGQSYDNNGNYPSLVEVWNGSRWTIQHSPNPASSYDTELYGVACPSLTTCTAVGYATGAIRRTLAEVRSGSQ